MKPGKLLKDRIQKNQITTGVLATFHVWPGLVELCKRANLDYLILDMEHQTFDAPMIAQACAIGRHLDFPILIRPPAAEFTPMRLALDLGPCGLLVPYVESAADVQVIQDAVYMKPRGRRRPGGLGNFWVPDYHYETWKLEVEDDLVILPQIESRKGLENVGAIAAHPLTTAIAVGPYDLSADLGCCWDPANPAMVEALARIRKAGRDAGKNMWMIGDGPTLLRQGFTFLCLAEPTLFLEARLRDLAGQVKRGNAADSGAASGAMPLP
jgi:2-keto-3-deoxy-L-rhamnonate aldolase RhmA